MIKIILYIILILSAFTTTCNIKEELFDAIQNNNLAQVKTLVESEEKKGNKDIVNVRRSETETGYTPFTFALDKEFLPIASYLIQHGANVNAMMPNNLTPLFKAVSEKAIHRGFGRQQKALAYKDFIEELIRHGAHINAIDVDTRLTPLNIVVELGDPDSVALLLENNADTKIPNEKKQTPLEMALRKYFGGSPNVLFTNSPDKKAYLQIISLILKNGTDPYIKTLLDEKTLNNLQKRKGEDSKALLSIIAQYHIFLKNDLATLLLNLSHDVTVLAGLL